MAAKVKIEEVVKRYLMALLSSHRFNKTTLAEIMETSRGHLNTQINGGRLTVDHINGIAVATTGRVSTVLAELHGFAKELEDAADGVVVEPTAPGLPQRLSADTHITPRARSGKEEIRSKPALPSQGSRPRRRHRPLR